MNVMLTDEEVRVLGSLIEKKMSTPDYYPLSLNALINACNQKVNRDPVVTYGDRTVLRAIDGLKRHDLILQSIGGRVLKYKEAFVESYNLADEEAAIMCVLLLRGPQTIGELRSRTERLYEFEDLDEVSDTLDGLMSLEYVVKIPRQPGQKEDRYAHLLSGTPVISSVPSPPETHVPQETPSAVETPSRPLDEERRLAQLEEKVQALSAELDALKQKFSEFTRQFE